MRRAFFGAVLGVFMAACGGGGDAGAPVQQQPSPASPTTLTVTDVTHQDTQSIAGASVDEIRISFGGPSYTLPASTTSAEACAEVRWAQETAGPALLTLETALFGTAPPGAMQVDATMDLTGPGAAMLTATRCGPINVASPGNLSVLMQVRATRKTMYRYTTSVRWTVKAVVP